VSLGELQWQRWAIRVLDGGMELKDQDGELFVNTKMFNNVSQASSTSFA